MSHYLHPQNILDLPPEIIVKIATKLQHADIRCFRETCCMFNEAGRYVQRTALHKMKNKAEKALNKCHKGFQNVTDSQMLRALKGTASVKCLCGIIRVADAALYSFIIDGTIDPTPPTLLAEVEKALMIASKKNPLVGRDRLKKIFSHFNKYFIRVLNAPGINLKKISIFQSVTNLLHNLPFKTYNVTETSYGLHCNVFLNNLTVTMNKNSFILTAPVLIQFLAKLNVKGIQEFINVNMGNVFSEEIQNVDATIDWIELMVECSPEQRGGVRSLTQACRLEPRDFEVRLHGLCFTRPPGERYSYSHYPIRGRELFEGEEIATYIYSSRNYYLPISFTSVNIFTNLV